MSDTSEIIERIVNKRNQLCISIKQILQDFEKDTNCHVGKIELIINPTKKPGDRIVGVSIRILIPE